MDEELIRLRKGKHCSLCVTEYENPSSVGGNEDPPQGTSSNLSISAEYFARSWYTNPAVKKTAEDKNGWKQRKEVTRFLPIRGPSCSAGSSTYGRLPRRTSS